MRFTGEEGMKTTGGNQKKEEGSKLARQSTHWYYMGQSLAKQSSERARRWGLINQNVIITAPAALGLLGTLDVIHPPSLFSSPPPLRWQSACLFILQARLQLERTRTHARTATNIWSITHTQTLSWYYTHMWKWLRCASVCPRKRDAVGNRVYTPGYLPVHKVISAN